MILKERVVRKWFARFRVGNFSVKNAERSGCPRTVDGQDHNFGGRKPGI